MKLKEFISLFRTPEGDVSGWNIKNIREDVRVKMPDNLYRPDEESRSERTRRPSPEVTGMTSPSTPPQSFLP